MLNPITKEREFNGVFGALAISLGLPALITVFGLIFNSEGFNPNFKLDLSFNDFFNYDAWKFYCSWFFGLLAIDQVIPGKYLKGVTLRDGTQLTYKINGMNLLMFLLVIEGSRLFYLPELPELKFIYDHQLQLTLVSIIFSFVLAVFVYVMSFFPNLKKNGVNTNEKILALGGNTGNFIYDWFMGRELNPRIGPVDIKLFCELKPGLLLWLFINLSCLYNQYLNGKVTDSMILINILQGWYIFDGVMNEEGLITMIDVTTDGFGFMLSFGDLALVPWSYSLQARFLSAQPVVLGKIRCVGILAVSCLGYYIFHSSNLQKSNFKSGKLNHMKSLKTKTGSNLLIDGWWKLSQHINYFGDWLIGLSWCLTTGFNTILTYFYIFYFAGLLIHRQMRDDEKCSEKYGESWVEYKRQVPHKIIPYVY
ncbi:delta(14)-sterol reductase [[Candida] jaroonii]|uniref:Delta(14)-sterol reductase n=1 Tax=[Candida] jaroonii TaxID=467808 RepID=A0ACA9YA17_9ASCO|nr:delta(14)-sterol reductase [[Candida] jaroonii]